MTAHGGRAPAAAAPRGRYRAPAPQVSEST
jgi:hypothetical protein